MSKSSIFSAIAGGLTGMVCYHLPWPFPAKFATAIALIAIWSFRVFMETLDA